MKKSKKYLLQQQRAEKIARMEYEDANGIKRRRETQEAISLMPIIGAKALLLAAIPVAFFMYSMLLLPLVLLYGLLYFAAKKIEAKANAGFKQSLWVKIPKGDSLIAWVIICIVLVGSCLSLATTSEKGSVFAGKGETEVRQMLTDQGVPSANLDQVVTRVMNSDKTGPNRLETLLRNSLTIFTGERELFEAKGPSAFGKKRMITRGGPGGGNAQFSSGSGGGGKQLVIKGENGEANRISLGGKTNFEFQMIFSQVSFVVILISLTSLVGSGVYIIIKTRKIEI